MKLPLVQSSKKLLALHIRFVQLLQWHMNDVILTQRKIWKIMLNIEKTMRNAHFQA